MISKEDLLHNRNKIHIVHYSCTDLTKPPITISAITIHNFYNSNSITYSLSNCNEEKELIKKAFDYFETHMDCYL